MTSLSDALGLVLELVTWLGLVTGIVLLAGGYAPRAFAFRYEKTWGVVIPSPIEQTRPDEPDEPWVRWLGRDRELRSAPIPAHHRQTLTVGDEVLVHVDRRTGSACRLDDPAVDGRLLRVLGWVLTGVGMAAAVAQLIVAFTE